MGALQAGKPLFLRKGDESAVYEQASAWTLTEADYA
jgi:hypothetical protein